MANPKYSYQVTQSGDEWAAEIVRRVSARRTMVSKSKAGFPSEAEAETWAKSALAQFVENLGQRNERKATKREQRLELEQAKALAASLAQEAREDNADDAEEEQSADAPTDNAWDLDDDL